LAAKALVPGEKSKAVRSFQKTLNERAESRFYPPLVLDSDFGPATLRAFEDLGWALGLSPKVLKASQVPEAVQAVFADPSMRTSEQITRARERGPKLARRTIGLDGTPIFWGLAKPLVRARERGWGGRLTSADRRTGVPERFGKKSQAALFACFQRSTQIGRCPGECGGDCNPANPPGHSSHELRSDGSAAFGGRGSGTKLNWWELGIDADDSDGLLKHLKALGYKANHSYPGSASEAHHINFTTDPGQLLPETGPNAKPAKKPAIKVLAAPATGKLKGIDVSEYQPSINWKAVVSSGRTFAWVRATDGLRTRDPKFSKKRWAEMKESGIARGAYHVARPQTGRDPRDEVREYLSVVKRAGGLHDGDLVPMLDVESYGGAGKLSAKATLEWMRDFVHEMHAQIGRRPIIYTGSFWRDAMGNPADDLDCDLWLAAYVTKPDKWVPTAWAHRGWAIWQHSETGKVPGVKEALCDLNLLKGGSAGLERLRM
jgi:GH25 family lysozyme M1 (1,4-beta-N-acetylmuramidase)